MWQVIFDLSLLGKTGTISSFGRTMCGIAWAWWLVAFLLSTLSTVFLFVYNIHYEKNFITPNSIKLYLDQVPCGVCCWRDNGRVLFSNICMNDLCVAITGGQLLNGNHFSEALADEILTVGEKQWRFTRREIVIGGERIHEMIASDVTVEYAETQALKKDKEELSRLNLELKEYTLSIDETVRHQEILQAKVNIHDEMNRLMLSTMVAESEDTGTLDGIFALWEQNALLLCMEAEETSDKMAAGRIEQLTEALKMRLIWKQELPTMLSEKQRSLFYSVAQEAIANAAKHAQAKMMEISYTEGESDICFRFVNDGKMTEKEVTFTGGLANLVRLAEEQGATISVLCGEKFCLLLSLPKK